MPQDSLTVTWVDRKGKRHTEQDGWEGVLRRLGVAWKKHDFGEKSLRREINKETGPGRGYGPDRFEHDASELLAEGKDVSVPFGGHRERPAKWDEQTAAERAGESVVQNDDGSLDTEIGDHIPPAVVDEAVGLLEHLVSDWQWALEVFFAVEDGEAIGAVARRYNVPQILPLLARVTVWFWMIEELHGHSLELKSKLKEMISQRHRDLVWGELQREIKPKPVPKEEVSSPSTRTPAEWATVNSLGRVRVTRKGRRVSRPVKDQPEYWQTRVLPAGATKAAVDLDADPSGVVLYAPDWRPRSNAVNVQTSVTPVGSDQPASEDAARRLAIRRATNHLLWVADTHGLSPAQRSLLAVGQDFLDGRSAAEIAVARKIGVQNVYKRLQKLRKMGAEMAVRPMESATYKEILHAA